jgi:hypothetical protein
VAPSRQVCPTARAGGRALGRTVLAAPRTLDRRGFPAYYFDIEVCRRNIRAPRPSSGP